MLPHYNELELPLLAELNIRGGSSRPRDKNLNEQTIYEALARYFELSDLDLQSKVYESDGTARSKWENMVRWARNDLKKKKMLTSPMHGLWAISEEGFQYLKNNKSKLTKPY